MTNEPPSNTSSSWPPTMFTYTTGSPCLLHARAHDVFAALLISQRIRRAVDDDDQLRAGCLAARAGFGSQTSSQISSATRMPLSSTMQVSLPGLK